MNWGMRFVLTLALLWIPWVSYGSTLTCSEVFSLNTSQANFDAVKGLDTRLIREDGFETSRGLWEYISDLTRDFIVALDHLRSTDLWIDFGAGKAKAAEEYLSLNPKRVLPNAKVEFPLKDVEERANVLAITYKYTRWFPKYRGEKLKILKGIFFEDLTSLPSYRLGSDNFGIFSYTSRLDHYFETTLKHLEVGGKLFIHTNFNRTWIVGKNGERLSVVDWVRKIPGIEVEFRNHHALIITKKSLEVAVPTLHLLKYEEDMPPRRVFAEE